MKLTKDKYKRDWWENAGNCGASTDKVCNICGKPATRVFIAETNDAFDTDYIVIKSLCSEHYNGKTQKEWRKRWEKRNYKSLI